jgi:signal transduction histidine kinase
VEVRRRGATRLGATRRNRVAYLAMLRRASDFGMRSFAFRSVCVAVVAIFSLASERYLQALALTMVGALACYLLWANEHHLRRGTQPRFWLSQAYLRNFGRTDGLHQLGMGSYLEIPAGLLLVAVPAWITTDEPLWARLIMLAAAMLFFLSASLSIFIDHTWFNPDEASPPLWHELARRLAGPLTALPVAAIALPADWGTSGWPAALAISLFPLIVSYIVWDNDLTVKYLVPLVREEAHAGRELVINEAHGALSTNLRLLEQQARLHRAEAPALHELAVSANSRLREILTLAQMDLDSSTDVANLAAPVFTLARAVGARAEVEVTITTLDGADRDLARLVLNDLVGNALNAGATSIQVRVDGKDGAVAISVTDDAPAMAAAVWKTPGTSSARLEARLVERSGSLEVASAADSKTVVARWLVSDESTGAAI